MLRPAILASAALFAGCIAGCSRSEPPKAAMPTATVQVPTTTLTIVVATPTPVPLLVNPPEQAPEGMPPSVPKEAAPM